MSPRKDSARRRGLVTGGAGFIGSDFSRYVVVLGALLGSSTLTTITVVHEAPCEFSFTCILS